MAKDVFDGLRCRSSTRWCRHILMWR